jgi:hypothetical protein
MLEEKIESNAIPGQLGSIHSILVMPSSPATGPTSAYPPGERIHKSSRRKAISFTTGQAATASIAAAAQNARLAFPDDTITEDFTDSPEATQVTTSEDTIMTDACAIPPSECEAIQVRSNKPVRAGTILIIP